MRALIISLNFNPGHVSHLVASYKQCLEIGYDPILYVNSEFKKFLPHGLSITESSEPIPSCELAIFLFPSLHNLRKIYRLRKNGAKIIYIFHEPLAPLIKYREAGFSKKYLAKLWIIDWVSALTVKWSNIILLPSKKAVELYNTNKKYKNPEAHYLPLMYEDEFDGEMNFKRKYISYIGTIAADHSFAEFLAFVKEAIDKEWFRDYHFLIATKSDFEVPTFLKSSPRVKVIKGHPLTDYEINQAYATSEVIWNAYIRMTQSGVLAKSYMFGTPAIVLKKNLNEFMIDGETVVAITDNRNTLQIKQAVEVVLNRQLEFHEKCRVFFLKTFFYRNYNEIIKSLIYKES